MNGNLSESQVIEVLYVTENKKQMLELIRAVNNSCREGTELWFTYDSLITENHNNRLFAL